jgi:hypothetical protein
MSLVAEMRRAYSWFDVAAGAISAEIAQTLVLVSAIGVAFRRIHWGEQEPQAKKTT